MLELANIKKAETEDADLKVLATTTEVKVPAAVKVEAPAKLAEVHSCRGLNFPEFPLVCLQGRV